MADAPTLLVFEVERPGSYGPSRMVLNRADAEAMGLDWKSGKPRRTSDGGTQTAPAKARTADNKSRTAADK